MASDGTSPTEESTDTENIKKMTRRGAIAGGAAAAAFGIGGAHMLSGHTEPALAATSGTFNVVDIDAVETDDGELEEIYLSEPSGSGDDAPIHIAWSGFNDTPDDVVFELEVALNQTEGTPPADDEFSTLFAEADGVPYEITETAGDADIDWSANGANADHIDWGEQVAVYANSDLEASEISAGPDGEEEVYYLWVRLMATATSADAVDEDPSRIAISQAASIEVLGGNVNTSYDTGDE